jgi:hypothetical protein
MYRVTYLLDGKNAVAYREFDTLNEAAEFSIKQPINSIIEIKQYDTKTSNIQNESNFNR